MILADQFNILLGLLYGVRLLVAEFCAKERKGIVEKERKISLLIYGRFDTRDKGPYKYGMIYFRLRVVFITCSVAGASPDGPLAYTGITIKLSNVHFILLSAISKKPYTLSFSYGLF